MSNWISKCLIGATCFLCSTFLLTGNTVAKTSERLESIWQVINELHPKATFSDEFAEGDLDGDGIVDVAYTVHSDDANDVVLGVLRGQMTGRFIAWEVSKPFPNAQHGFEIYIEKRSLFIHGFNGSAPRTYESHWQDQFQLRTHCVPNCPNSNSPPSGRTFHQAKTRLNSYTRDPDSSKPLGQHSAPTSTKHLEK